MSSPTSVRAYVNGVVTSSGCRLSHLFYTRLIYYDRHFLRSDAPNEKDRKVMTLSNLYAAWFLERFLRLSFCFCSIVFLVWTSFLVVARLCSATTRPKGENTIQHTSISICYTHYSRPEDCIWLCWSTIQHCHVLWVGELCLWSRHFICSARQELNRVCGGTELKDCSISVMSLYLISLWHMFVFFNPLELEFPQVCWWAQDECWCPGSFLLQAVNNVFRLHYFH